MSHGVKHTENETLVKPDRQDRHGKGPGKTQRSAVLADGYAGRNGGRSIGPVQVSSKYKKKAKNFLTNSFPGVIMYTIFS
jgi:hypothetical protein